VLLIVAGRYEAQADARVATYDLAGTCRAPLTLAVMSDLHVSAATTPPQTIAAAVATVNALHPDVVLLAGDYLGKDWPRDPGAIDAALRPLGHLRARLGTVAVLGNNDWEDAPSLIGAGLGRQGVHVLHNDAWVTPNVAILGIEELISNTANPVLAQERYQATIARRHMAPPILKLWLAHQPAMFDRMTNTATLLVAGHTHGGQILPQVVVPLVRLTLRVLHAIGRDGSWPASEYVRGLYANGGRRMLVTSGIGVSGLPLRIGVPPEIVSLRLCASRSG
jgi:hypothetical protein